MGTHVFVHGFGDEFGDFDGLYNGLGSGDDVTSGKDTISCRSAFVIDAH